MRLACLFIFSFMLLLAFSGCTLLQQNEQPSTVDNAATGQSDASAQADNASQNSTTNAENQTNLENQTPAAQNNSAQQENISASGAQPQIEGCEALAGEKLAKCASDLAGRSQNATFCARIIGKDLRFSCLSLACNFALSGNAFCEGLPSAEDRLFCLQECNS